MNYTIVNYNHHAVYHIPEDTHFITRNLTSWPPFQFLHHLTSCLRSHQSVERTFLGQHLIPPVSGSDTTAQTLGAQNTPFAVPSLSAALLSSLTLDFPLLTPNPEALVRDQSCSWLVIGRWPHVLFWVQQLWSVLVLVWLFRLSPLTLRNVPVWTINYIIILLTAKSWFLFLISNLIFRAHRMSK